MMPGTNSMAGSPQKRYRVVMEATSAIRLGKDQRLQVESPDVLLAVGSTYRPDEHGTLLPGPLAIVADARASDRQSAQIQALALADLMCSIVALAGNGPVHRPRLLLTYEIRADEAPREFEQFFHDDIGVRETRKVTPERLNDLVVAIDRTPKKTQDRLKRALRQHRLGLLEDDPLERFILVMTAFEALNPLFAELLGVPNQREEQCPHCGGAITRPSAAGIYTWLTQVCDAETSDTARAIRNGYVHGYRDMDELATMAAGIVTKVEAALVAALGELMSVEKLEGQPAPLPPRIPFEVAIRGTLSGLVEESVSEVGVHPHLLGGVIVKSSKNVGPDGDAVQLDLQLNAKVQLPPRVNLSLSGFTTPRRVDGELGVTHRPAGSEPQNPT